MVSIGKTGSLLSKQEVLYIYMKRRKYTKIMSMSNEKLLISTVDHNNHLLENKIFIAKVLCVSVYAQGDFPDRHSVQYYQEYIR